MFTHDVTWLACVDGDGFYKGYVTQRGITQRLGATYRKLIDGHDLLRTNPRRLLSQLLIFLPALCCKPRASSRPLQILAGHRLSDAPDASASCHLGRDGHRNRRAARRPADPASHTTVYQRITQFVNLGTTIPTLAIFALAMSVLGIGAPSAIFGLAMLTLLPIVLNTVAGCESSRLTSSKRRSAWA